MSFETIKFDRSGAVATITLDRADAANSLNLAMGNDLLGAANICNSDDSIRARHSYGCRQDVLRRG